MLAIFSTLEEGRTEQSFFDRLEAAAPDRSVTRFVMSDRSEVVSDRIVRVAWSLKSLPPMQTPRRFRWRSQPLPPGCVEKWTERWCRCTGAPAEVAAAVVGAYADYLDNWFRNFRPSGVLVSSNSVPHTGLAFDLAEARSIPRATFERGYLPDSFQISGYGSGPFSEWSDMGLEELRAAHSSDRLRAAGAAFLPTLRTFAGRRPQEAGCVPEPRPSGSLPRPPLRVLFLPVADASFSVYPLGHPDHDRILPAFRDSVEVAVRLGEQPDFEVVVKPHPTERNSPRWRGLGENLTLAHSDAMPWIDWADVVVCNGTTLEFSAIARGTPVVLAGRSLLSNKRIAEEIGQASELAETVRRASAAGVGPQQQRRFEQLVGWLRCENLVFPEQDMPYETERRLAAQLRTYGMAGANRTGGLQRWFGKLTRSQSPKAMPWTGLTLPPAG